MNRFKNLLTGMKNVFLENPIKKELGMIKKEYQTYQQQRLAQIGFHQLSQLELLSHSSIPIRDLIDYGSNSGNISSDNGNYELQAATYIKQPWVQIAVSLFIRSVSSINRNVTDKDGAILIDHPITRLFRDINPNSYGMQFSEMEALLVSINGNSYAYLVPSATRNKIDIAEIQMFLPNEVTPVREPIISGSPKKVIVGYKIKGVRDTIPIEQMLHYRNTSPFGTDEGISPLIASTENVLLYEKSIGSELALRFQQMRPDFLKYTNEETLSYRQEIEELEHLQELHSGVGSIGNPHILRKGEDIKPLSWPDNSKEVTSLMNEMARTIIATRGVPPEISGLGNATYENWFNAMRGFYVLHVVPYLNDRDAYNTAFFRRTGRIDQDQSIKSDISKVQYLQEGELVILEKFDKLWGKGIPLNVLIKHLGLDLPDDIPGGDIGYIEKRYVPANSLNNPDAEPETKQVKRVNKTLSRYRKILSNVLMKQLPEQSPDIVFDFEDDLTELIENSDNLTEDEFEDSVTELVTAAIIAAHLLGSGKDIDEITQEEQDSIEEEILLALLTLSSLTADVFGGRFKEGEDGEPSELNLSARVRKWAVGILAAYVMGTTFLESDPKMRWDWDPAKEHCKDCKRLNGQVHRASEWRKKGWLPQSNKLECSKWGCGCRLTRVDNSTPISGSY